MVTQPAHVTEGLPQGYFDTIVINSVVQYFPSADYLGEVIETAVGLLAPGGALFIGDVRNHSLQGAFQTGIALARTASGDVEDIRQRVQHAMLGEPELLLAPEFFTTWVAEHAAVAGVGIEVKRGEADNELTRYRYDVTIHKSPAAVCSLAQAPTWQWADCAGLSGLHTELRLQRPTVVRVRRSPAQASWPMWASRWPWQRGSRWSRRVPRGRPLLPTRPRPSSCIASPRRVGMGRGHLGWATRHAGCHLHRRTRRRAGSVNRSLPANARDASAQYVCQRSRHQRQAQCGAPMAG